MNGKRLYLSNNNRALAGVCGGIAEFFGIDSTIVRVLWIIFGLCLGSGVLTYFVCWLIMPKQPYF